MFRDLEVVEPVSNGRRTRSESLLCQPVSDVVAGSVRRSHQHGIDSLTVFDGRRSII